MTRDIETMTTSGTRSPAKSATQLRFEADRTMLASPGAPEFGIKVGPQALAARYWGSGTPNPLQIEHAIDDVEMALMSERLAHGERGLLVTAEPLLCSLPGLRLTGATLTRDAVEVLFNALAAMAESGRSTAVALTTTGEAAAALLILRELMHHLGFDAISRRALDHQ